MRKYLFLLSFAFSSPALAQVEQGRPILGAGCSEDGACIAIGFRPALDVLTVLASGQWQLIDQTGQAISVIGESEIEALQGPDLTRALSRLPGVSLTRNGDLGGFTGVSVRGSATQQVLVLVDGVRVNDVSSPAGGFDFGGVSMDSIERIELLRGSNSVVWGSEAIGGVLALTTRAVNGFNARAEYGNDDTFSGAVSLGRNAGPAQGGITAGLISSEGISAAAVGRERDGFEQRYVTARGQVNFQNNLFLTANARFADGEVDIDGFPPPDFTFADTAERQDTREWSGRIGGEYLGSKLRLRGGFSIADNKRDLINEDIGETPYYSTEGRSERAEAFAQVWLWRDLSLDSGAAYEWTRFSDGTAEADAELGSAHALLGWYGSAFTLAAGVRIDDHDAFGSQWSLGANAAYRLSSNLRIRASYGEGFKVPTLFQLRSDFGNSLLTPETSRSYDAGIDWRGEVVSLGLTLFRRDTDNLIDFISCVDDTGICEDRPFGTYDNVGEARAQGVEASADLRLAENLTAGLAYSYIETEDRTPGSANAGKWLARRPRHNGNVSLEWTADMGLKLGGDLRLVGDYFDDAGNNVPLKGHALADIRFAMPVDEAVELFGRLENIWDEEYVVVSGYGTPGRSVHIGARLKL